MPDPYISEVKYRGPAGDDFVEVAVDEGTAVGDIQVVVYHPNGRVRSTNDLDTLSGTQNGKDIYTIGNGIHKNGAVALVQDGVVLAFISFDNVVTATRGPANGMTSTQIGSTGNNQDESLVSTDGGSTYTVQNPPDPGTIPCFLRGTRIFTPRGYRRVENLKVGDLVRRADGVDIEIRWHGSTRLTQPESLTANAPVRIPKGAFGQNTPERDLFLSPNHRVMMSSAVYELYFNDQEVLIPAKHLVGWRGISVVEAQQELEYHHLLFDQHEVVLSEGLTTESFHPGDVVLDGMAQAVRDELLALFPQLINAPKGYGQTARPCLNAHEAEILRGLSA